MRGCDTARDCCVVTLRGLRRDGMPMQTQLVHCNTHPELRSGAATVREGMSAVRRLQLRRQPERLKSV